MEQAVTGAYGYSGKHIATRLLAEGHSVRTLTNSPDRHNPFGDRVPSHALAFDDLPRLAAALEGVEVLHNTYWVRFNHDDFGHAEAVENTVRLFEAARHAGVRRVVHISITNPSLDSDLEYFRGKARIEAALRDSGLSHAILRPAVLFGGDDILVNNIAWALRRLPVFGIPGNGGYRLQPIHVDDRAALAADRANGSESTTTDAIGPETFTFRELVECIGRIIGRQRPVLPMPPRLAHLSISLLGRLVGDVILTRPEITGLMQGLLCTGSRPTGTTRLTNWAREHRDELGAGYSSELARRRDRTRAYQDL